MVKISRSVVKVGLLQAVGVTAYCGVIAALMWNGNRMFGKEDNFMAPLLALLLLSTSALVCALMALGYPVYLIWQKKETVKALKVVGAMAGWMVGFTVLVMLGAILF